MARPIGPINETPAVAMQRRVGLILWVLAAFPIACFSCALCTDVAYSRTANIMWADFSAWLLAAGMAGGGIALVAGLVGWLLTRQYRIHRRSSALAVGSVLTLAIALMNNFVHSRDGWTSVVPQGLMLSAMTVVVMLATLWLGYSPRARHVVASSNSGSHQ